MSLLFVFSGDVLTLSCVPQSSDLKKRMVPWSLSVSGLFLGSSFPSHRGCLGREAVGWQPPPQDVAAAVGAGFFPECCHCCQLAFVSLDAGDLMQCHGVYRRFGPA